ncbi:Adiponectin receptor protein [Folsomia candida]|uniref:Adiponectin receptor protein n=2 Tax=Folsomia candida TaxID=158441 RepID=A0A226DS95_FOLCA|nr:Adiponectin receptor protein [Folsomia candida]
MNIWTHLVGMLLFFVLTIQFLTRPEIQLQEKFVFTAFFVGAIACLGFSTVFHTLHCHSREVAKFVHKLDYVGIALLIMGSFFPWVYYGFYCKPHLQIIYMTVTLFLGTLAIIASMMDTFAEPRFRPIRAGLFAGFGLSGVIPAVHYASANGLVHSVTHDPMGWLVLMAFLYLLGAVIYAGRVPERWFLGKCDIWGHSHQLFHVLVVAAALVNYHGIMQIAKRRLTSGECRNEL